MKRVFGGSKRNYIECQWLWTSRRKQQVTMHPGMRAIFKKGRMLVKNEQ
jgi:hypothetical protein